MKTAILILEFSRMEFLMAMAKNKLNQDPVLKNITGIMKMEREMDKARTLGLMISPIMMDNGKRG